MRNAESWGDRNVAAPCWESGDCGDRNARPSAVSLALGCAPAVLRTLGCAPAGGASQRGEATFLSPQDELPSPRFFSREAHVSKSANCLPHWEQSGCCCFVTWRTADSIPQEKLNAIREERELFDAQHEKPWNDETWDEYHHLFEGRYQRWLDEGAGACVLRQIELRRAVENVIMRFDRLRYVVYALVVMPNHVHVLFMPLGGHSVAGILKGWKGVSARVVNMATGADGSFWQKESWDHCVRSAAQFRKFLDYIRSNDPKVAYSAYDRETRR